MIKIDNVEVFNLDGAIRGMRQPMNSHHRSDSKWAQTLTGNWYYKIGQNDLDLMRRLYKAGKEHRKYTRQIMISVDITAPLYWWKEFDTYKIGTTANSTSTMHKIMAKEFTPADFSYDTDMREKITQEERECMANTMMSDIAKCNNLRDLYIKDGELKGSKTVWRTLIQTLPSSYNQTRTVTMNYEVFANMYFQRRTHKLSEWVEFCNEMLDRLPYLSYIMEV